MVIVPAGSGATGATPAKQRGGPQVGIACTAWASRDARFSVTLGNRLCRVEFDISTSAAAMDQVIGPYARAGIRVQPLAGFVGRLPSEADAQRLATWAERFGPRGAFWRRWKHPLPIQNIEFGNETSYTYQYPSGDLASRARDYALRAKDASIALRATGVGLLVQADDADTNNSIWVDQMFSAVPDLAQRVSGWTIHPYGDDGFARIRRMVAQLAAVGSPRSVPIFITEWGLASVNGGQLSNNYGYATNMTYAQAAATLRSVMARWKAMYGSRIAEVIYYMLTDLKPPGSTTDGEQFFGALKVDGSRKGEYTLEVRAQVRSSIAGSARQRLPSSSTTP